MAPATRLTALFELIEIDRAEWNAWLANPEHSTDGPALRDHLQTLIKTGKATLVRTAIVPGAPGETVRIESVGESIYPSEGDPAELAQTGTGITHRVAAAFETRNTGLTVEIEFPVHAVRRVGAFEKRRFVASDAAFKFDRVLKVRDDAHGKDENEWVLPVFYSVARRGKIKRRPKQSLLISSHRPAKAIHPEREDPVHLSFLRIDVIELDP